MLQWFYKPNAKTKNRQALASPSQSLALAFIEELAGQIAAPKRAAAVLACVARFRLLPPAEQEQELPATYLLLEQFLVEVDSHKKFTRAQLRDWVRARYEALLALPHFSLLFQPLRRQEVLLCRRLLDLLLERAYAVLGATEENLLATTRQWLAEIPATATLPAPFNIASELPQQDVMWVVLLRELSHHLYLRLESKLGEAAAGRLFAGSYQELVQSYVELETFPVVINLLPEHLLDEQKIRMLSRSQMQRVLFDKIEELQNSNDQLALKNQELERAQTDLVAAGESAHALSMQLSAVLHTVGEGIITIDATGTIVMVNQEVQNIWGYEREELLGKNLQLLMPEKYRSAHAGGLKRYLQTGVPHVLGKRSELEGLKKDGTIFPLEVRISETNLGERLLFTAAVRDITERRQAEQFLQDGQERCRAIVEASPIPMVLSRLPDGEILYANAPVGQTLGIPSEKLVGAKTLDYYFEPGAREALLKVVKEKGNVTNFEICLKRPDGTPLWTIISVQPMIYDGAPALLTGFYDVTMRKEAESEILRLNEILERRVEERTAELQATNARLREEIAERKRAEDDRDRLFTLSSDMLAIAGLDGYFKQVNPTWKKSLGYTNEEFLSRPFIEIIHPDDREGVYEVLQKLAVGEEVISFEVRVLSADGGFRWASWNVTPFLDEGLLFGVGRDITERKQIEETLRRSEERFRTIIENSLDIISILHVDGTIRYESPSVERVLGYKPEEMTGNSAFDYVHPDDVPLVLAAFTAAFENPGTLQSVEFRFRHKDGSWRILESIGKTLLIGPDNWELVVNSRDLTERKRASEALLESEIRFRSVVESAQDAIVLADETGFIVSWNKGAEKIFGYAEAEVLGQPLTLLMPGRFRNHHNDKLVKFDANRESPVIGKTLELFGVRKDGSEFPLELCAVTWKIGEQRFFSGMIRDITERKRAEEQIRRMNVELEQRVAERTAELRRSNDDLQQFAYVASHDLQEPLRMVSSYVQLLERRYKNKLDSDADEFIRYAVDGAQRMQTLIKDLLSYSRVGTHGKPFVLTDCEYVLGQVITNLHVSTNTSGAQITHTPLPVLVADSIQLVQLFQNLVSNAIKFRSSAKPLIHICAEEHEEEWQFSVRDNGIGLDPVYADRIFIIFQRLHSAAKYPGTGIGLAICKKIVERHSGRIWLESKVGEGATFYFTIRKLKADSAF